MSCPTRPVACRAVSSPSSIRSRGERCGRPRRLRGVTLLASTSSFASKVHRAASAGAVSALKASFTFSRRPFLGGLGPNPAVVGTDPLSHKRSPAVSCLGTEHLLGAGPTRVVDRRRERGAPAPALAALTNSRLRSARSATNVVAHRATPSRNRRFPMTGALSRGFEPVAPTAFSNPTGPSRAPRLQEATPRCG